jgi:2-oxoglutarate ferredoxin oxidoreductase subunit gamma
MSDVMQIRWSGFGGQGVVLAGVLLGQAGMLEGKSVSASNSYGAQARGSACKSEVVFSDRLVDFPHLLEADVLVAMSQGAYDLYFREVKSGGLILYDEGFAVCREGLEARQIGIPATRSAVADLKEKQVTNIVLLGALMEITHLVSATALRRAIQMHVSERFRPLNLKALALGKKLGATIHG